MDGLGWYIYQFDIEIKQNIANFYYRCFGYTNFIGFTNGIVAIYDDVGSDLS